MAKPGRIEDYDQKSFKSTLRTFHSVLKALGDQAEHLCVVGGLVPSLIVEDGEGPMESPSHPGTLDVDLAIAITLDGDHDCDAFSEALRAGGV